MKNFRKIIGNRFALLSIITVLVFGVTHAFASSPDRLTFLQGEKTQALLNLRSARLEEQRTKEEFEAAKTAYEAAQASVASLRSQISDLDAQISSEIEPQDPLPSGANLQR